MGTWTDVPPPPNGRRFLLVTLVLGALLSVFAHATLRPPVGLFHDDGVYIATAKSLAEGRGYRITSLPTEPPETKYPIAFPLLLSIVWRIEPTFPQNVDALRWLGAAATMGLLVGAACLRQQLADLRSLLWTAAFLLALAANSLVANMSVMVLSDMLFAAVCVATWLIHVRLESSGRVWPLVLASACLSGFLLDTRQVGITFGVAGAIWAASKGWRFLAAYLGVVGMFAGAARLAVPPPYPMVNPLFNYYTGYETAILAGLLRSPIHLLRIVVDNLAYAIEGVDGLLLPTPFRSVTWLLAGLAVAGAPATLRRGGRTLSISVALYSAAVLMYPFNPTRYLLPLAPVMLISAFNGPSAIAAGLSRVWPSVSRVSVTTISSVPLAFLVLTNLVWAHRNYLESRSASVRLWDGARAPYSWTGFQQTIDWINRQTPPDAVLAAAYDPMYYLYTGRRGVRPWFHQPDTYFYPKNNPHADVGRAADIRPALDNLSVSYLVVDPIDAYAEKPAVDMLWPRLLEAYGSRATLVFQSDDALHRIYRIAPLTNSLAAMPPL